MVRDQRKRRCSAVIVPALVALTALSGMSQSKMVSEGATVNKGFGSQSAPIRLEVFSDFQCPACRELYEFTLRPVIANYVSPGKVYLIHRDMPLPSHRYARQAARYANAAAIVGKLERVVEALYANQPTWSVDGNIESVVAAVLTPAEMAKVRQLLNSKRVDLAIDEDVSLGQARQVRSTPTVFVTHRGQLMPLPPGGVNYPLLKQYLDHLLRQP